MMGLKMKAMTRKAVLTLCAGALLGACGGSGGGDDGGSDEPVASDVTDGVVGSTLGFTSTSAVQDSSLRYVAVTTSGEGSNGNTGALDHDGNLITGGLLEGTINGSRTRIELTNDNTGAIANLSGGLQFVRVFGFEGSQYSRFGVVGIQTGDANVPDSGTGVYSGTVQMQATNSDDSYSLTGNVAVSASFAGAGNVTSTFDQLSGTGNNTGSVGTGDTGTITITGATISNGAFTGGTASGTGPLFDDVSGAANLSGTRGEFFGPAADEVGGVLSLSQGDLLVTGVYTAD